MAQDKRVFTGGMDKDSDPRLIKMGDYRDALNIRSTSSSDSTSGSVENIEGNTLVPFVFIDETDQLIEVTPIEGHDYTEEVDSSGVFQQTVIEIGGKEQVGGLYNFTLSYLDPNGTLTFIPFSPISWVGNSSLTSTSTALYSQFGDGGLMSEIQVVDFVTGFPITLTAVLNFTSGDSLNGDTFTITYTCDQAGATFFLSASSSYSNEDGVIFGAEDVGFGLDNQGTPIYITPNNGVTIGGYKAFISSGGDLGGSVDDVGNAFGPGPSLNTGGSIIDLEILGDQPEDPSIGVSNDVTLFSYTQTGSGGEVDDFLVEPVIDLGTAVEAFGVGGEFEFTTGQDSIAGFLSDILSDDSKLNNILVDGGNGTTTSLGGVSTNFLSTTKLKGDSTAPSRNNSSEVSYAQLEYYYDSTEVIEGDGFSIDEGTLTFSGEEILSSYTYALRASIIENKNYLLSFTVSGLPSGTSFNFHIGNDTYDAISKDGIHSVYMTPGTNSSIIYITFNKDFTSSDEVVITNLRLSLEDSVLGKMTVRLASLGSTKFNLAFATSEEELKLALARGDQSTQINEWFPGVGLSLVTKNIGDGYGTISGVDLAILQAELVTALEQITLLTDQIASTAIEYAAELANLQTSLEAASNNAEQIQLDLDSANALNSTLTTNIITLEWYVTNFLISQTSGADLGSVITFNSSLSDIQTALSNVNAAITDLGISTLTNSEQEALIEAYINNLTTLQITINSQAATILNNDATILTLTNAQTNTESSLAEANDTIDDLASLLNSNISIDGSTVQETINIVATYDISMMDLKEDYDALVLELQATKDDLSAALLNQEDGITQADVAAVQTLLDAATSAAELIAQELIDNPSPVDLTEHVQDTEFLDESKWDQSVEGDWIFGSGGGVTHNAEGDATLETSFSSTISAGSYIFSINVTELTKGENSYYYVTYIKEDGSTANLLPLETSVGRKIINFTPSVDVYGIRIYVSSGVESITIDSISLVSASSNITVAETVISNLISFVEELKVSNNSLIVSNQDLEATIVGLVDNLASANADISVYNTTLSATIDSLGDLGSSLITAIEDLSLSSSISQDTIDQLTDAYSSQDATLLDQLSYMTSLVAYLNTQIEALENNSGGGTIGGENDKWLFTFNGGIPVNTTQPSLSSKTLVIRNTDDLTESKDYTIFIDDSAWQWRRIYSLYSSHFNSTYHPLYKFIQELNEDNGYDNYNSDLQLQSNPSEYIFFPTTFNVNVGGVGGTLKFTVYNLQSDNLLIDENGDAYTGSSTGDKIIGDQGNVSIVEDPTSYLDNQSITTGIQIGIEALDGTSGWEFYIKDGTTNVEDLLTTQSETVLAKETSATYGWNVTSPSNSSYIAPDGIDYRMYFEKIQSAPDSSLSRSIEGSAESFVAAATSPDFSIGSMAPKNDLIYPSKGADIIVNKSRDVPPNLSEHITGAKRFVKNKMLNKTTVRDNSSSAYRCIGTYEDKPKNSIYYFVHHADNSSKLDCILEFSLIDNKVRTVYQDGRQGSNGVNERILNFSKNHAITGVNKIDDILYWTDNLNRPRKINVKLGKQNEANIAKAIIFEDINFPGTFSNSVFLTYNDIALKNSFSIGDAVYTHSNSGDMVAYNGYAEVLGIVRKMPTGLTFNTTDGSTEVTSSIAIVPYYLKVGEWIGIMDSTNFPRFYQVADISGTTITTVSPVTFTLPTASPLTFNGVNIGGLLTNCPFESYSITPGVVMLADPSDSYSPLISFGDYDDKMRYFDVIKHQPKDRPVTELASDLSYAKNNILDTLFQFKYRYLHQDNENTSYSGVSNINIDPEFARNTPLTFTEYRHTANSIEIEYFDTISDVKKIEITTRKGNDGEFTLVDTVQNNFIRYLKSLKNEVITSPDYYFDIPKSTIKFRNNGVYPYINKSEGDKLFDAVPKLAKAQTILSDNRVAYGNILEGYDNVPLVVSSGFETEGFPIISTNTSDFNVYGDPSGSTYQITNADSSPSSNSLAQLLTGGGGLQSNFPIPGSSWTSGNSSHCRIRLYLDLQGLELNSEDSQHISFDVSYSLNRELGGIFDNNAKKRAGRIAMSTDITGLDTINQVQSKIIEQFNAGDWEGGTKMSSTDISACVQDEGEDSQVAVTSSGDRLKLFWKHKSNSTDNGGGGTLWATNNDGWKEVVTNVNSSFTSGKAGVNSFKTGAFHDFGISYFDETNRCSFVNIAPDYGQDVLLQEGYDTTSLSVNLNGTRPYNYFPTEGNGPAIGQSSGLKLNIYNKPPRWATSYQVMYAGNTSVDEFMQVTVPNAIAGAGGDTQMYLSLQSLKSHKSSYTEATGALTDFEVADGDRIRFISCMTSTGRKKFNDYLDFEITGFEYYNEDSASADGNPIDVTADQAGFYIRIANPGSDTASIDGGTVSIDQAGFSGTSGTGYDKLIAELYRPKKSQTPESTVYFEVGDRMDIGDSKQSNNYHTGTIDQNPEYFYSNEVNTDVSLTPAVINLNQGDIYIKSRTMFTADNGASLEAFPCEDYYLNDFHSTNHYDKGRINVVNNNAEQRRLDTSVYYSEPYVSTGSVNGLSSFNLANTPWYDYSKEFGSIQSLKTKDNDLIIFHESKVGRVLVGQDILNTASGEGLVSLSNNVIDNYASLYAGQFGCGLNPESIVKHGQKFYFADVKRGAMLRLSNDGLTIISDYGMKDYFRDLGEMYIKYNPDQIKTFEDSQVGGGKDTEPYLLVGGYDPKYNEYVITFPEIEGGGRNYVAGNAGTVKNWSDGILNWDDATLDPSLSNTKIIFNAVTLGFSEGTNKWTSFYSYVPEFYSKINKQFVSFKNGRVYRHNNSDLYSNKNSEFNNFYGNGNLSYIDFVFNASPSSVKSYNAIGLESDTKFITGMFTNMGQYYGNYDDVTTTSIAFKRVGGLVNSTDNPKMIVGNGTSFYEDVAPGDLVRVFGYAKRDYTHKDFIVEKVISNSLISVNEDLGLDFIDSYMLVIDYKSKEGIQYSSIPFIGSGLNSLDDNLQFGDGSEIQGLGVAEKEEIYLSNSGSLTSASSSHTFGKVSANKHIPPSEMIVGGSYVVLLNSGSFDVSSVDSAITSSVAGTVFTCKTPSSGVDNAFVISTDIKLYVKNEDNTTTFLGYPYGQDFDDDKVHFVPAPNVISNYTPGFYFTVKSGDVEGEKMKGSYMRTILATNKSQSKKKFNLYAANADVDKSELSDK